MFEYAGQFWTVMPNKQGTWLYRLDGANWTQTQKISASKSTHADIKVVGDLANVLLYDGVKSQFATLEYNAGLNQFEAWASQPNLVNIPLSKGVETATIEADSTGRLWIASDAKTTIERITGCRDTSFNVCAPHARRQSLRFHYAEVSIRVCGRRLPSILTRHHSAFSFGHVPCSGHPCQKHPSTKTAMRRRGKAMSERRRRCGNE